MVILGYITAACAGILVGRLIPCYDKGKVMAGENR